MFYVNVEVGCAFCKMRLFLPLYMVQCLVSVCTAKEVLVGVLRFLKFGMVSEKAGDLPNAERGGRRKDVSCARRFLHIIYVYGMFGCYPQHKCRLRLCIP